MRLNLILPKISEFMEAGVVDRHYSAAGEAFSRGEAVVRITVEMSSAGDALACPPGLVMDLVAAEPGILLEWAVSEGERVAPGSTMAIVLPGGVPIVDTGSRRILRCVLREVLE